MTIYTEETLMECLWERKKLEIFFCPLEDGIWLRRGLFLGVWEACRVTVLTESRTKGSRTAFLVSPGCTFCHRLLLRHSCRRLSRCTVA